MNQTARLLTLVSLVASAVPLLAADRNPYAAIDRHALRAPKEDEKSVESLARYLIKPAKTDAQKARAIYRWVADRIAYNVEGLRSGKLGDNSTAGVLKNRRAVCDGFANLFLDLCKEAGVEAAKVGGLAKGIDFQEGKPPKSGNHAWNAVKVAGKWALVDATWGAGGIQGKKFVKQFKAYYFLPPPDQLIFSHFPKDPKWQLLTKAISEKEFREQPRPDIYLFLMGATAPAIRKAMKEEGFRELVKVFPPPGEPVTLRTAPLQRHLKEGTRYRFRIESSYFGAVAVHHGGRWRAFTRKGKVFEGVIVAPKGVIKVRGLIGNGANYRHWDIMEYVGE
jgi:hypothetical protein